MDFEIWVYRGLIGLLLIILWFVVQRFTKKIDEKFDELIAAVHDLSKSSALQNSEIRHIERKAEAHDTRLNDHSKRIRKLETENNKSG